jgi:pyridoxal phosphate enzyme (YggS family)
LTGIQDRYRDLQEEVRSLAHAAGRVPPLVVVVTKNRSEPELREAYRAGARDFGENRAQELEQHRAALADLGDLRWHFLGHLQTNKVGKVVGRIAMLHSADSVRLLEALEARLSRDRLPRLPVLLEVNVAREPQKHGLSPEELPEAVARAGELAGLEVRGLMAMAPQEAPESETDRVFGRLRELHEELLMSAPGAYRGEELSMGMSSDYRSAIRQGATMVRIGSAIFEAG